MLTHDSTVEAVDVPSVGSIEVIRQRQHALGQVIGDLWTTRSLAELAEEQGVGFVSDITMLQDESIGDEDAEAFITALGL